MDRTTRVVPPETEVLEITGGDWLLVKKRLNAGDERRMLRRGITQAVDGTVTIDTFAGGLGKILAYLLDWSLVDPQGAVIPIAGEPDAIREAALDALDPDSYGEILKAIEAHRTAMAKEREDQKKAISGAPPSSPISRSLVAVAGATNG